LFPQSQEQNPRFQALQFRANDIIEREKQVAKEAKEQERIRLLQAQKQKQETIDFGIFKNALSSYSSAFIDLIILFILFFYLVYFFVKITPVAPTTPFAYLATFFALR
jgi:membrane-bound ClpP family serine protease